MNLKRKLEKANKKTMSSFPIEEYISSPGYQVSEEKPRNFLKKLIENVVPIFEKVYEHPSNTSRQKIKKKHFLGAHPVSLDKAHLENLIESYSDFVVCEKTDGIRYLMYITNFGEVVLAGRNDDYYIINMDIFPGMVDIYASEMKI